MNYEIEDETRDFVTSYAKEFHGPKLVKNIFRARPFFSEYAESNPVNDAYKEYLNLQKKNERLPPRRRTENPQDLLDRVNQSRYFINKIILLFGISFLRYTFHT